MKKVAVLFAYGFEEVEAVTPVDFLRRAGIEVITAGIGSREITGAHGIKILTDTGIDNLPEDLDGIIIPGGMPGSVNVANSEKAVSLIKTLYDRNRLVAAICAAPAEVLSKIGILDAKKATCYPGCEAAFTSTVYINKRVVVDGNIITSQAPGTAAEFAVEIIRHLKGDRAAADVFDSTCQK